MFNGLRDILAIPFGWALNLFYDLSGNYLLSLILITLILKLLLLPTAVKQQKNSAKQMRLQAKVNKIRAKYATLNQREAQMKISEETQELYRREGFSAANMGCMPMLLQLLVMTGLYGAIYSPLSLVLRIEDTVITELTRAYTAVMEAAGTAVDASRQYQIELNILNKFDAIKQQVNPEIISDAAMDKIQTFIDNFTIFGINLTQVPNQFKELGETILIIIPVLAGLSALLTSIYMYIKQRKTNPEMAKNPMMGCMTFMSPAMSIYFAYILPAGVGFYWIISNILSFIQTVGLAIAIKPDEVIAGQMIDETVTRRSREQNIKIKAALMKKNEEDGK